MKLFLHLSLHLTFCSHVLFIFLWKRFIFVSMTNTMFFVRFKLKDKFTQKTKIQTLSSHPNADGRSGEVMMCTNFF